MGIALACSPAMVTSAMRTEPHAKPLANWAHSPSGAPPGAVTWGSAIAAGTAEAARRSPDDPVSTKT
jgi:hypothetical protein